MTLNQLIFLSLTFAAIPAVHAAEPDSAARPALRDTQKEPPIATSPEKEETRLTKNWGGFRSQLSDQGVDLAVIYKGQVDSVRSGGLERRTTTMTNIDLRLSLDLDKLAGWKGGSAFVYGLLNHGNELSSFVGDKQVTSNIEAPKDITKLYEAWIQQLLAEGKVSVLFGLHDLNSEFYVADTSTLFFNSSFGVGKDLSQTGVSGPSIFPTTSVALRLRFEPTTNYYMQVGVFNSVPSELEKAAQFRFKGSDGALLISEAGYLQGREENSKDRPMKVALGLWTYTLATEQLLSSINAELRPAVSQGAYALVDRALTEPLSAFVRYGLAATNVNPFESNLSVGFVYTGLIPGRDKDRLGLSSTRALLGSEYRDLQRETGVNLNSSETTYELTYRAELIPGVAVQPDAQYVVNPSADPAIPNATVLSARLELSF